MCNLTYVRKKIAKFAYLDYKSTKVIVITETEGVCIEKDS